MELLSVLITTQHTLVTPVNNSTESGAEHTEPESHIVPTSTGGIEDVLLATHCPKSSRADTRNGFLRFSSDPALHVPGLHQYVKPIVSLCWSYFSCTLTLRAGPVMSPQRELHKVQSQRHRRNGVGLIISIYMPRFFRQSLGLALCAIQMKFLTSRSLHWSLDLPRIVSTEAEVFQSARAGLTGNIQTLLSLGMATAKDVTIFGTTLLHSASKTGNVELVRLLIQEGADVNAQDEDGESALHGALATSRNYNIARILIEHGADLSLKSADGRTPFHTIYNDTVGQCLTNDEWLDHMSRDSEGMTLTHFLAWSSRNTLETFQQGRAFDSTDLLAVDILGRNCLHFAASRGNLDILSYLMKQISREHLEIKDDQGRTPLHYAAESNRAAGVIDILVRSGCNTNAIDGIGRTALHWAAQRNNTKAVEKLAAIGDQKPIPLYDLKGRLPSQVVDKQCAPDLFRYLEALESSKGLIHVALDTVSLHHHKSSHGNSSALPTIQCLLVLLIIILIILLGMPD